MKTQRDELRRLLSFLVLFAAWSGIGSLLSADEKAPPAAAVAEGRVAGAAKKAEVLWGGTWYPAQMLEEKDGKFFIKYDGYGDEWNEWVGKDRIRLIEKPAAAPAGPAEVEWAGTWYPAKVLESKDGKFFIKYDGYGDNWNEWVGKERIRFPGKPMAAEAGPAEVEWGGSWYPAKVLKTKDGKFYIKYDGYGDNWNEWVGKERIRFGKGVAVPLGAIEVEWAGTWYPAKVLESKDGKFLIKYDGYGDTWNEWVGKERLRKVSGTK